MMVCTAKRAICLGVLNKIDVLANYEEKVNSPSLTINLPSVIKIRDFIKYDNLSVDLNRKNILSRDEHLCQYCGDKNSPLTIDHILPKGRGGQDLWENLVAACKPCNQKLGTGGDLKKGSFRKDHEIKFELFQQLLMNQNKPNVIQTKLF